MIIVTKGKINRDVCEEQLGVLAFATTRHVIEIIVLKV